MRDQWPESEYYMQGWLVGLSRILVSVNFQADDSSTITAQALVEFRVVDCVKVNYIMILMSQNKRRLEP